MSGGSYDYICYRIEDFGYNINNASKDPKRAAFAQLVLLIADAAHDIEWVDSGDYGEGDEHKAIDKCFSFLQDNSESLIKAAAYDNLTNMLKEYFNIKENK